MMRPALFFLFAMAVVLRFYLASQAPSPGIADPTYYFNLGQSIRDGRGLEIDFLWQYHNPPPDVTHQSDYYPPLTGFMAALGIALTGNTLLGALLPSTVFGGLLLPWLVARMARDYGLKEGAVLIAAGVVAFYPEFILNSVRTDTTIFYVTFAAASLHLMALALFTGKRQNQRLIWAGIFAGLAYLTRLDAILILCTWLIALPVSWFVRQKRPSLASILAFALPLILVSGLWLARNQATFGRPFMVHLERVMFVTEVLDLFSYEKTFTLQSYLAWGGPNIFNKIAFEGLGNIKMMILLQSVAAPLSLAGIACLWLRDRRRLWLVACIALFALGTYAYYTVLTPFLSQSGSFKKAIMVGLPWLAVFAAAFAEQAISDHRMRLSLGAGLCGLLAFYGLDLTRADFAEINRYEQYLSKMLVALRDIGDTNGDKKITLFTQDPFQWNYYGFRALMYPNDSLNAFLILAERYHVDYFIFPADRHALQGIQTGAESLPWLRQVWADPRNGADGLRIYQFIRP
jgi:4-amino-4-deoxy-L-arabinose transferase-like glycosyltransferase